MTETHAARRHPEYVVLEIGDDVGALIVHADAALHGVEVEISPTGRDADRSHKDVLERSIDGRPAYTAVFDQLAAGSYTLWTHGVARSRGVVITGGEIAQLHWAATEAQQRGQPHAAHHQHV
jgi:hypothetical protein